LISQPIVFLLGAGASRCFEFPLGQQLCELVIRELKSNSQTRNLLKAHSDFSDQEIDRFQQQLAHSGQNSIDAFLETRQEFLSIGKAAMSIILIRHERQDILWSFEGNNWLRYLFDRMRAPSLEKFVANQVAFITFNFDRSLENFLFTSLQRTFGASDADVARLIGQIPIIHLHGRLGFLPWQSQKNSRPYNDVVTRDVIDICVNSIRLVHEEVKDGRDKDFSEAKRILTLADKIYILGFGFGQINVERLQLAALPEHNAFATANGYTSQEVASIAKRCANKISIYPNHNIESFFRELVAWD
jgi:hypothetical protein